MFRMQGKLMFQKRAVRLAFLVSMGYAIFAFFYEKMNPVISGMAGIWYYCGMGDSSEWSTFTLLLCFLIPVPAMSFQWDISDRTLAGAVVRGGRDAYLKAKMQVVFWTVFALVVLPLFTNLLLCLLFIDHNLGYLPSPYGSTQGMAEYNLFRESTWAAGTAIPFSAFFKSCPLLYVLCYLVLLGAFAGLLGVALVALSFWFRYYKILLFLPVFALTKLGQLFNIWSYNTWYLREGHPYVNFDFWAYVAPISYDGKVYLGFLVLVLLLCGFSYLSFRMIRGKEYLDV